ncbi:Alpha-1,6-mannosylglycoprotein 6-beta-N-acetylglucosaminyltransferase A [Desmophyllum pertusum]|uniref:alpha-1,6-mannosyl-glycoprotein 6-beta-N-acetylglucosaminyltransferase n=1 Tax=Desmophyllum pertusum TaxID=174260 RepID=A0A9W9ZD70_9CNID|nr:Alpha-1,6-mannosylglycoprotein 6-beta-N-acetylglucosaminyltransferase A [Desmophyllum pertusum]
MRRMSNTDVTQRLKNLEQHIKKTGLNEEECKIPHDWLFPFCEFKVSWMQQLWDTNKDCYVGKHNLKPENLCSIIIYLSEVERFCPVLPWRQKNTTTEHKPAKMRFELDSTFINTLTKLNLRWMRDRITRMWPLWVAAAKQFEAEGSVRRQHQAKKIFIFFGTYAYQPNWLNLAFGGAPLGEMVQWSDLLASLYSLGHDLTISANNTTFKEHLSAPKAASCSDVFTPEFDLIFTDYNGLTYMQMYIPPNLSPYSCRIRILDSFGTEAEFNYGSYQGIVPGGKSAWARADLHLRQIFTMFPHSPDNSFLGFVVSGPLSEDAQLPKKKPIGLVYGKDVEFWEGKREYLDTLHKYLEIHGTFFGLTEEEIKRNVPEYVIAHGILSKPDLEKLLQDTKVFIGLGFPYEGPAPLEAIAQGCIFLNGKFDPPHNRLNTEFFKIKPTLRELTSQHPYAEVFIGKPHVFTIDIKNLSLVEETVKEILNTEAKPYLPLEWTPKGMLERVNAFNEHYNFCEHGERWPPLSEMKLFMGEAGKSCVEVCKVSGLLCESTFFVDINSADDLEKTGVKCESVNTVESLLAPSYDTSTHVCTLQKQPLLFSCVAKGPQLKRLCPCRDFQPQQVAFCKQCH